MSLLNYYQYLGKGKIRPVDIDTIRSISNPGAICTVERHMVINPFGKTFTLEEVKEIVEFILKKIEKDESKSSNNSSSTAV
jgi:transketolase C-terminal domain/subunit